MDTNSNYTTLTAADNLKDFVDMLVIMEATPSEPRYIGQHMMPMGIDSNSNRMETLYIEPITPTWGQMVVSYSTTLISSQAALQGKKLRLHGRLGSMTGSKGGSGDITQLYLNLDKIEVL